MSFQIIAFYNFKDMAPLGDLQAIRAELKELMKRLGIKGTIILAEEGYNSTLGGTREAIADFIPLACQILEDDIRCKSSYHDELPFRRVDVKVKKEIVTLKRPVDIRMGSGTHVPPARWNELIQDPDVLVLDTRNHYEYSTGTFRGALDPGTVRFSDLPDFVDENLDPKQNKRVAMFCTGGVRCEKFAPYLKAQGFAEVYQLEGGILKYLEVVPPAESLWDGECFVFDSRISVDSELRKGSAPDHSAKRP